MSREAGRQAYEDGFAVTANPYDRELNPMGWNLWVVGWYQGMAAHYVRTEEKDE